ncbi:MAG: glycoside hydrolase domain-containing protein [Armatimonadota bacterium]
MRTLRALACLLLLGVVAAAHGQAYVPDTRTLLLDHLDDTFTPDGKLSTKPAKIMVSGDLTGGQPMGGTGAKFVPGKYGNALQMHGLMQMTYPSAGNINLTAGQAEFWVALNFDAAEVIKNPGLLSNQCFLPVWGPGGSRASVYSCLNVLCVCVQDVNMQIACYASVPGVWKKGEWHHVVLKWGRSLELSVDDQKAAPQDWTGLFGPIDVKPDDVRLTFGSPIGWGTVESEYALDEVRVQGPGGGQLPDSPLMTVCRLKTPPTIDGKIEDAEWVAAARTTGFVKLNENVVAEEQTVLRMGFDDEAFYLSYECLNPTKRDLTARLKDRDSGVFMEDAVDFLCRPDPTGFPYYHFIVNAIGTVYDSTMDPTRAVPVDLSYSPSCTFKTSVQPDRWMMECKIPFRELGGRTAPKDGERWRVNFCRDGETMNRYSSWAYAAGNFHGLDNFGELVFSNSDRAIQVGPLGDLAMGKVDAQLNLTGFLFDPLVIVKGKVVGSDAKTVGQEQENRLADYRAVTIKAPPLVTGKYDLTLKAATAQGPMYYQRIPFRVIKAYDLAVEGYPYEGKLWITANVKGLANAPEGMIARSRLMLGQQQVAECSIASFKDGLGEASLPIDDLAPGKYTVKSEAVAPDGKVLGSAEAAFEQFAKPAWWKNTTGIDHSVPNPWTPVKAGASKVSVLGREYQWGGALPRQIVANGQALLAAPITMVMSAGGATADLAKLAATEGERFPDVTRRNSATAVGPVGVTLTSATEFDGLQRYALTLTPKGAAEVSSLQLDIPINSQYATFLCPSNGSTSPALTLPKEGWKSGFMPQVWVGNDDVGFAFVAESDEWWRPHDGQMVEVVPQGSRTTIRCNMIRQPLKLTKPVTITFALMATPVKDAHAGDPFWVRFGEGEGKVQCQEWCRYPATGNIDLKQGTMECWFAPSKEMGGTWRNIMGVTGAEGDLQVYYLTGAEQVLNVALMNKGKQVATGTKGLQLAPGKFAHVAVTWSDKIRLFVDGKLAATLDAALPSDFGKEPSRHWLMLGCPRDWQGYTKVTVDEFRVSRSLRYTGDYTVPTGPFAKDADTLLLDHFENAFRPDGEDGETRAEAISGQTNELGGVPSLNCKFVPAKFGQGLDLSMIDPMPREEAMKRWGFNAKLWWFWLEQDGSKYGWPSPLMVEPEIKTLREDLKEDTKLGLRPSTYAVYPALGSPSPLSDQFGYEWSRRPMSTQPNEPPKGHYFWDVCARSGWSDYNAAGSKWLLDDVGMYGLYTDGGAQAYACRNTHHGCGWTDEQGQVHPTFPVFATREMLKRMYRLIHERHADGYLVNHMSFNTLIPTMSFTDVMYSGEHEQYEDLTRFRVRWTGKQWGFWTVLLGGDAHIYETLHQTWCLLHGVSVWPQGWQDRNDASRKTANLWQTYDRFGYRQAQWLPYFKAGKLAVPDSNKTLASLYLLKGKRALVVIGNTTHSLAQANVALDLKAMGLKGKAVNALTGETLTIRGNVVSVRLRPDTFVLAWVE